ncbi:MAG: helix-turn-helix domain-containing protein [Bacillota bacterium]|jgi:transcriptional regulator with XRE-family HTH domain
MRETYKNLIKTYLRYKFIETREALELTQEEMAERLSMSFVAYNEIEAGINLCSTTTFILFLINCSPDRELIFNEIQALLQGADQNVI